MAMAMRSADAEQHGLLAWKRTMVDGRLAFYGEAGDGVPVLFLHGWALGHHSYKPALKRLIALGCHVWAPALPGFGGTPEMPASQLSFAGYGGWVERFCDAAGIEEPVVVVGHSFGGGVAIRFVHDAPSRVRQLVLVNSVGGSSFDAAGGRSMAERPLWDWGRRFPGDIMSVPQLRRMVPVLLEDALPNMMRNPYALWKVAQLVRAADLSAELAALKSGHVPVVVLWAERDEIIPRASFEDLCRAIGAEGEVVPGAHSWLLSNPDAFGKVMARVLGLEAPESEDPRSEGRPAAG